MNGDRYLQNNPEHRILEDNSKRNIKLNPKKRRVVFFRFLTRINKVSGAKG